MSTDMIGEWLETMCIKAVDGTCPTKDNNALLGPSDPLFFQSMCSIRPDGYLSCPNKYHFNKP